MEHQKIAINQLTTTLLYLPELRDIILKIISHKVIRVKIWIYPTAVQVINHILIII